MVLDVPRPVNDACSKRKDFKCILKSIYSDFLKNVLKMYSQIFYRQGLNRALIEGQRCPLSLGTRLILFTRFFQTKIFQYVQFQ